jgi:hypothetical protein
VTFFFKLVAGGGATAAVVVSYVLFVKVYVLGFGAAIATFGFFISF